MDQPHVYIIIQLHPPRPRLVLLCRECQIRQAVEAIVESQSERNCITWDRRNDLNLWKKKHDQSNRSITMSTESLSAEQNAARGYTITRVLSASRERVWDAWTKPEQFAIWFGGHQCRMEDMHMDVRPSGDWSGTMVLPDGTSTISWRGHFLELDHPSRLVLDFTDQGADGKEFDSYTVTLTTLSPGRTQMVVRQSGGHLTDEQYKQAEKGTGMFMDVLAEMIAGDI